jgi:hypothetical protein
MQVRRHDRIPRTRLLHGHVLGKRASDQTQAGQQTQYDEQSGAGTTSSSHSLSFLLGSFVLNEAGEPGRDLTQLDRRTIQFPAQARCRLYLIQSRTPVRVQMF